MWSSGGQTRSPPLTTPSEYDPRAFPPFAVTVDVAVLTVLDGRLCVLLVRRGAEPFRGMWALPGGFKHPDETLDEAAARELREETGVTAVGLRQVRAYGDPGRDPRMNVVTVCYVAAVPDVGSLRAGTDADTAQLWPIHDVLRGSSGDSDMRLAFDHEQILRDVISLVQSEIETSPLATQFLGETFTMSELRSAFDVVLERKHDPGNFHRRFTREPGRWLIEVGGTVTPPSGRGRPAAAYRRSSTWTTGAPGQPES